MQHAAFGESGPSTLTRYGYSGCQGRRLLRYGVPLTSLQDRSGTIQRRDASCLKTRLVSVAVLTCILMYEMIHSTFQIRLGSMRETCISISIHLHYGLSLPS